MNQRTVAKALRKLYPNQYYEIDGDGVIVAFGEQDRVVADPEPTEEELEEVKKMVERYKKK